MVLPNIKPARFDEPSTAQDQASSLKFPSAALWAPSILALNKETLGQRIEPLLPGDPAIGNAIYHGEFKFSATEIRCRGTLVFDCNVVERPWLESLHGFAWIHHIRATGRELNRLHARALISDWIAKKGHRQSVANSTAVMSRRVISWITCAHYLCEGDGELFHEAFLSSLAKHVRDLHLRLLLPGSLSDRLDASLALSYASIGLLGLEASRSIAFSALGNCLDRQILPDGGHVSRNPQKLVQLLLDLLPLRLACDCARIELPLSVHGAIERMIPMVRFFMHGDGGIAIFHGANNSLCRECDAIMQSDEVHGKPFLHASYSGYGRLSAGTATVICDVGEPPDRDANPLGAAAPLSFEFSDGPNRIVMNCGSPPTDSAELQEAGRRIEAHSTAAINSGRPTSSPVSGVFARLLRRNSEPRTTLAHCEAGDIGSLIDARSQELPDDLGKVHERSLFLSSNGTDLRGEDRLSYFPVENSGDLPFAIRFHLHPSIKVTPTKDNGGAVLVAADKTAWKFSYRGGELRIEESIRIWGTAGPRKTAQIVLRGFFGESIRILWAFKKIAPEREPPTPVAEEGKLPFLTE